MAYTGCGMKNTASETPASGDALQAPKQRFEIRIKGHLSPQWSDWFEGFVITHTAGGETLLTGAVTDQSALHGLLARIRDLNLALISVNRVDPDRENRNDKPVRKE